MSDYRDDTTEMMVAGDQFLAITEGEGDSAARAIDTLTYRLRIQVQEGAAVAEEWTERARSAGADAVQVDEVWQHAQRGRTASGDTRRVVDSLLLRVRAVTDESLQVAEQWQERGRARGGEHASVGDEFTGRRRASSFITDTMGVRDASMRRARADVMEVAGAGDEQRGRLHASVRVFDSVGAADAQAVAADAVLRVLERALVSDTITGTLRAVQFVTDSMEAGESFARDAGYQAQAWTANVRNWATSRYAPYTFDSVAVIGGVAYVSSPDGVFALDGDSEDIAASLRTGKLDLSGGGLAHPLSVYLEYELVGTAALDVTTTQSGAAQTYTYPLAGELAEELTNGRFILGRGLRGRHFTLGLRLTGKRGLINDMAVDLAPTKRRV